MPCTSTPTSSGGESARKMAPVSSTTSRRPASLLIQCIGALGDLWSHIGRFPSDEVKNAPFDHRDLHGVIQNQAGYHSINKYREHLPPRQRLKSGETDERQDGARYSISSESR